MRKFLFEPLVGFEPTTPRLHSYRTATTKYPCYVPILGDSEGAGRMRLVRLKVCFVKRIAFKRVQRYYFPLNPPNVLPRIFVSLTSVKRKT